MRGKLAKYPNDLYTNVITEFGICFSTTNLFRFQNPSGMRWVRPQIDPSKLWVFHLTFSCIFSTMLQVESKPNLKTKRKYAVWRTTVNCELPRTRVMPAIWSWYVNVSLQPTVDEYWLPIRLFQPSPSNIVSVWLDWWISIFVVLARCERRYYRLRQKCIASWFRRRSSVFHENQYPRDGVSETVAFTERWPSQVLFPRRDATQILRFLHREFVRNRVPHWCGYQTLQLRAILLQRR